MEQLVNNIRDGQKNRATNNMNQYDTPEKIREFAIEQFNAMARAKYDKGQIEHGGLLTNRDLIADLKNEAIDTWMYACALEIKLKEA
jgi:hypothetical protein